LDTSILHFSQAYAPIRDMDRRFLQPLAGFLKPAFRAGLA